MYHFHQKKLHTLQEKMKDLQAEQVKTEQALGSALLKALKSKNAFSLDMNTLIGGFFFVIDKIEGDGEGKGKDCESWQKVGQQYFNKKRK